MGACMQSPAGAGLGRGVPHREGEIGDQKIATVGSGDPPHQPPRDTLVIDGGERVLIPGLSDAHAHVMLAGATQTDLLTGGNGLGYLKGAAEAEAMLMRGFTTIRDMAGDTADLKLMIDAGALPARGSTPARLGSPRPPGTAISAWSTTNQ